MNGVIFLSDIYIAGYWSQQELIEDSVSYHFFAIYVSQLRSYVIQLWS